MGSVTILTGTCFVLLVAFGAMDAQRIRIIPIEAIFDDQYPQLETVYKWAIDDFNKRDAKSRLGITLNVSYNRINGADAFELNRICM
jgi:hypothetical protein